MPQLKTVANIDGQAIQSVVLQEGDQSVALLSIGVATQDWRVAQGGRDIPVVLGYENPVEYLHNSYYMGVIAGRVANRIGGAHFQVDGRRYQLSPNEGENLLHGGRIGLGRRNFAIGLDSQNNRARFSYHSPDGEEGFPGAVDFTIDVTFADGRLTYEMRGQPDRPTPINLAQHSYYNLNGGGEIWDHRLRLAADRMTPTGAGQIPTGEIAPIPGWLDYRSMGAMGDTRARRRGADDNLVLANGLDPEQPVAEVRAESGLCLRLWTDQPAIQYYTGGGLGPVKGGHIGQTYQAFHGFCLEPQHFPDAINQPEFASIIATPEQPYHQKLTLCITGDGR